MPKPKKVGRPKLPKGKAKGQIVPVRFMADDLKAMTAAARVRNLTLSRWIRVVTKNVLKGGSATMTMQEGTTYEEQTESGKGIVKEILARLAKELNNEQMNSFVFKTTHQDFDQDQVSILDPERDRVVAKVEECDLADAPTTPSIRRKLETQLNSAVRAYFKVQ